MTNFNGPIDFDDDGGDNATVITTDTGDVAVISDDGSVEITYSDGTTESFGSDDAIPTPTEH